MSPGPVDWRLAQRTAVRFAGREPLEASYHYDRLVADFEEVTAEAEELVAQTTGLRSSSGPARARVVDRAGWIEANISSFQRLLRPLTDKFADHRGEATGLSALPGLVGRRAAGVEVGVVLGWIAGRVLGQYDLLIAEDDDPDSQDMVYYVGPNVLALEKRYAFPPQEFRLWLALHEVTHRAQFTGIDWLRDHFLTLVHRSLDAVEPDPKRFLDAAGRAAEKVRSGGSPFDDGLPSLLAGPEQRDVLERIGGMMSLLEGHGDVTMNRAGADRVPSAERFARAMHQRRQEAGGFGLLAQRVLGFEAKLKQYRQGELFIGYVETNGGPGALEKAWRGPEWLPTLAEIRTPQEWLDRVQLSEEAGSAALE